MVSFNTISNTKGTNQKLITQTINDDFGNIKNIVSQKCKCTSGKTPKKGY